MQRQQRKLLFVHACVTCVGLISATSAASADEEQGLAGPPMGWSLGTAFISNNQAYRGTDADSILVPAVGYESPTYFIRGLSVGRNIIATREQQVWVAVTLDLTRFKPQESRDEQMALLDRRLYNAQVGSGYRRNFGPWGSFSVTINTDISGRHLGQRGQIQYSLPLNRPMQAWQLSPSVGVNYMSRRYVDYYYGVSQQESQRSGLASYKGEQAINPYIGISGYQFFNERVSLAGGITLTRSASAIRKSPMIERGSYRTVFLTLQYRF